MNIFTRLKAYLRFKEAMRQADAQLVKTGQRHYVLPGKFCDLFICDRHNFRGLRLKHYITNSHAKMAEVVRECFYHTPYKSGTGAMEMEDLEKRWERYYVWYERERRRKAAHKVEQRKKRHELRRKLRQARKEVRNERREKKA